MIKSTYLSVLFWLLLGLNITGIIFSNIFLANSMKVLLMPTLAGFLLYSSKGIDQPNLIRWILTALLFSWMGDIFLIFQEAGGNFFLLGLGSFLLSHISYIISYTKARNKASKTVSLIQWLFISAILGIYLSLLFIRIGPGLEAYTIPVILYAIAISFMLLISFSRKYRTSGDSFLTVIAGACMFVISDSLIALNKFWEPVFLSGIWIMITYGTAQYLIIVGLAKHIQISK